MLKNTYTVTEKRLGPIKAEEENIYGKAVWRSKKTENQKAQT